MNKLISTEGISKGLFTIYLEKAEEFYKLMKFAEEQHLWNGAGLNAVHCAISSCDALSTFYLGERSRSQKHADAVILFERIPLKEIASKTQQLSSILAIKNLVEYEARDFYKRDAQKITTQAERLYKWIRSVLPNS